jgi:hypothetical protein
MSDAGLQSRVFHLLSLAKTIRHYEEALSQARGERFNLFDILHVGHYEVRTHSPMLAELLNPQGSHGQGAVFLKHFLAKLNIHDFDADSAHVGTEVPIGKLGRLDIVITDGNRRSIFIENKIYALLQDEQLERYHEHDPKANLLFLTLNGDPPADWATNTAYNSDSFRRVFQSVSYKTNIVRWLESCRKEAATAPGVREAITQYIHLIQRLTQQNTSARMNNELIEAVLKANWDIRKAIFAKLNAQLEPFIQGLGLETVNTFSGQGEKGDGCLFRTPALEAQNLRFGIECEVSDYRDFFFGFRYIGSDLNSALKPQIQQHFKVAFPKSDSSPVWPAWSWWDQHRNWDDETMSAIFFGEFAQDLKALIGKLAEVAAAASKTSAVAT